VLTIIGHEPNDHLNSGSSLLSITTVRLSPRSMIRPTFLHARVHHYCRVAGTRGTAYRTPSGLSRRKAALTERKKAAFVGYFTDAKSATSYVMLFVPQDSCDYPSHRLTIEVRQGWEIWHCEYDLQGQSRLPPVAIVVVSVCVVSHALCVNTNIRTFNTCVCLHPTGLQGNSMILHAFVNLGLSASATQKKDGFCQF